MNARHELLIPTARGWLRTLQLGLLLGSIGWGISFFFTFASWDTASDQLFVMGAGRMGYHPLLDYWLRMASAAFGCIGIAAALACFRPRSFPWMILLLGIFHFFMGCVLAVSAVLNKLDPEIHPTFQADITFCFVTAILILVPLAVTRMHEVIKR
jgi:hypothetical protein